MRNPERVLNSLSEHSKVSSYKFERLYRVLFNSEMFLLAYHNIQGRQGNMTEGSDGKTIDGMSLKRIENLSRTNQNRQEGRTSRRKTGTCDLSAYRLSTTN